MFENKPCATSAVGVRVATAPALALVALIGNVPAAPATAAVAPTVYNGRDGQGQESDQDKVLGDGDHDDEG